LFIAPASTSNQVVEGIHISDLLLDGQKVIENFRLFCWLADLNQ
jgi:hypothetical protein